MLYLLGFIFVILGPLCGGLLSGIDRVFSARMQRRQGPPLLQPFADYAKFMKKKSYIINGLQTFLVAGHLIFIILSGWILYAGQDILLSIFSLTLSEMFLCMAAFSASAPYSNMSAQRELMQMACTEPMLLMIAIGFYLSSGSFMVTDIISQKTPAILHVPGFFIGFLVILIVELRKSPFDVSTSHHAHQEMVKGVTTDITGSLMGIIELSEWYEYFLMFSYVALYFISSNPASIVLGIVMGCAAMFLMTLIDNIFPRVRWERMLSVCWATTLIFAGGNLLLLTLLKMF